MPLHHGYSQKSIGQNIAMEERSGHPKKQSEAIALSMADKARKMAAGGTIPMKMTCPMCAHEWEHDGSSQEGYKEENEYETQEGHEEPEHMPTFADHLVMRARKGK